MKSRKSGVPLQEDVDDFCCEAEEDIEAGAIGLMTSKINKFDNHNVVKN